MNYKTLPSLALALSMALSANVQASEMHREIEALNEYCRPDIKRLCPGVEFGEGRIKQCLHRHKEQVSVGCAKALKKLKDR